MKVIFFSANAMVMSSVCLCHVPFYSFSASLHKGISADVCITIYLVCFQKFERWTLEKYVVQTAFLYFVHLILQQIFVFLCVIVL